MAAHKPIKIIQPKSAFIWSASNIGVGPGNKKAAAPATPAKRGIAILTTFPPVRRATANTTPISKTTATSKNRGNAQTKPAIPSA